MLKWYPDLNRRRENLEPEIGASASSKFWAGSEPGDQDEDQDQSADDPRKDENWRIQERKGFLKDRESKAEHAKLSKTVKRNSKESIG